MLHIKNAAMEAVLMETHRCNKSWSCACPHRLLGVGGNETH